MSNDRKKRNLELLKNAVDRDRSEPDDAPPARGRGRGAPTGGGGAPGSPGSGGGGNQIMYRGQPVGRAGGGAPGAPGGGRGAGRPSRKPAAAASGDGDVKEALRKLTQLFNDGLITTAEYDAKRSEILNRL